MIGLVFSTVMTYASFLYLDVTQSKSYLNRWRPQFAADRLVSVTSVSDYVRARISLENDSMGSLVSEQGDVVFVLGKEDGFTVPLLSILAQDVGTKLEACRDLRAWNHITEWDASLLGEEDTTIWEVSQYDA